MLGKVSARGDLKVKKIRAKGPGLAWKVRNYLRWSFIKSWLGVFVVVPVARMFGILTGYGKLEIVLFRATGEVIRYGVVSYRLVTTAFVDFITDQLQTETSVFGDFKYHDGGTGTTGANIADTAIETTDGEDRASGSQTESAHNVYVSVGTVSYTGSVAVTEHGLFNASTGPTLMDRHTFSAVNVVSGDSIQFTYSLTLTAGG